MKEYYKKSLPLTVRTFLSILSIIFLIETVRSFDFYVLSNTWEALPYLVLAIVSGFLGIPLFFYGLEKITKNDS